METFFIKALQLILSLSILVVIHEFGHFLFARLFKIRVEKFYLFFNPGFSLFKYKPKNSDTEYGIGWLPLGGYVKISGMIDESMDKEQMAQPEQPWEFRSKPSWQRLLVMIGGVVFNIILAFFIYSMVLFTWNDTYLPLKNVTMGMEYSQAALDAGFKDGDILLSADGKKLERFGVSTLLDIADASEVVVLRDGTQKTLTMNKDLMKNLLKNKEGFATYLFPTVVSRVMDDSSADKAGLKAGDSIVSINSVATATFSDFAHEMSKNTNSDIMVGFYRNGEYNETSVAVNSDGKVGFIPKSEGQIYNIVTREYGFFESFPAGIKMGVQTLKDYVAQFKYVFTKEGASSLGGFGTIGNLFPPIWNWYSFWMMTAFLSVILAFMNILPIPGLDGGHVLFLMFEMVSGRKPNEKFMEYAQIAGMILLLGLVVYANGMDIFRAIFK